MIFHVVTASQWQQFENQDHYVADSLAIEGFIHCSTAAQVAGVLQRYYAGATDTMLLHIDENFFTAELKYELAPSVNELFPHVFGAINKNAIMAITDTSSF
jgi:uncharacterized protein (DUF952 family)